jgi:hypothetical protein
LEFTLNNTSIVFLNGVLTVKLDRGSGAFGFSSDVQGIIEWELYKDGILAESLWRGIASHSVLEVGLSFGLVTSLSFSKALLLQAGNYQVKATFCTGFPSAHPSVVGVGNRSIHAIILKR